MSTDRRPRLDDILGGTAADFNSLWDGTAAAGEFEPLPPGRYTCLVADGRLAESKAKGTPSYKVEFQVLTPAEYAGRKVWCDLWLTPAALPTTKRDLAKLRITRPEQMKQAPPTGLVADVKVALRTGDDGTQFNRVATFEVTGEAPPAERIARLYEESLGRLPTTDETTSAIEFLTTQGAEYRLAADAAVRDPRVWADLCHVLWNVKEFVYIP